MMSVALQRIFKLVREHLMLAMGIVYVLGGVAPRLGVAIRGITFASFHVGGEVVTLSLAGMMLSLMLFNAGLGVSVDDIVAMVRRPRMLLSGVIANMVLPLLLLLGFSLLLRVWPEQEETQQILVGLALIGAMPIAGGATVWTQNADGSVALTVGMVLVSSLLSPVTIPLSLRAVSRITTGDYAEDLADLAAHGGASFAIVSVVIPCALGIVVRHLVGGARMRGAMPAIKAVNTVNILMLAYSNASVSLGQVFRRPDLDMLALVVVTTVAMCALSFWVGWRMARALRAPIAEAKSLTFGVGMNNSSASSVLATTGMPDHPLILLPILAYSMTQKLLASGVDSIVRRRSRAEAR